MDTRHEYAEKMKAQIDRWNREADALEVRARGIADDARAEIRRDLDGARARRDEVLRDLSRLQDVGRDAWDDVTREIESSWKGIRRSLERAAERVTR